MSDLLIKSAKVIDGTNAEPQTADVLIQNGRIQAVGHLKTTAHQIINADGALLTPGFIDIHTHYDGQVSWDDTLSPSLLHGTTSILMGNCGVGFAPVRPGEQDRLIRLMEGVEEIPGAALSEGIRFNWESFEQYMDVVAAAPRSINTAALVPHDCLRYYVMGERAARLEAATAQDVDEMKKLLQAALRAGAMGFSTGRSDNHRTSRGEDTPSCNASALELNTLASALQGMPHRVLHAVNDFDAQGGDPALAKTRFDTEYALMRGMAQAAKRPLALTWLERLNAPPQWQWLQAAAEQSKRDGLDIKLQTASRAIGVLSGLDTSFCVLTPYRSYQAIAHLALAERAAKLRDPAFKAALLVEQRMTLAGGFSAIPPIVDHIMATLDQAAMLMFDLSANASGHMNYEPDMQTSFGARAQSQGITALEALYDHLAQGDGGNMVYFPIFNYLRGSLDTVHAMLTHPQALYALGDAGAHVGTVCDASSTTTMLAHWARDRPASGKPGLTLARAVHMLTQANAHHLGWLDRGVIEAGALADLNLIDLSRLGATRPQVVRDLPAGGKRVTQAATGYLATWVKGELACANGQVTPARAGGFIRGA